MRSLVGQARDEGVKSILPRLADVSTQRLIVRLDLEKYIAPLQTLAMYSQRIARMGIVVVAFYLTGIALAKRRSYAFIGASTLTLLAALGLFTTVNFVIDEAQLLTSDPVVKNAVAAIATQLTATLVLYARQIALLSVFGILIGFLLSPLRIFRSLRRFLGFEWIQRKYRNTRMSRNMNTLRGMLYQYRAGIGFTTAIVLILVLMFAQGVDAVMVIRGISWWMILYSLITLASKPQEIK